MILNTYQYTFRAWILILSGIFVISTPYLALSEETEQSQQARIGLFAGHPVIHLTKQQQNLSGLITNTLQPTTYQSEIIAYGEAIDLQSLVDLRSRFFQAEAAYKITQTKLNLAQQSLARVRNLHRNDAISKRKLQIQQSQAQEAQAHHDAIGYEIQSVQESALLNWGNPLSEWAFNPDSKEFSRLLSGQQTLLQITLPPNLTLPAGTEYILVSHTGMRNKAVKARFLSPAQDINEKFQGETLFFSASGDIQTGMHVTAWIARKQDDISGVILPFSAIVRHLGQTYVYLKKDVVQFTRHQISTQQRTADGYFIQTGILPGDELVTIGAQMLLSEEFRSQIPDEDDD